MVDILIHPNKSQNNIENFVLEDKDSLGNPLKPLASTFTRPCIMFANIECTGVIRTETSHEYSIYIPPQKQNTIVQLLFTKGESLTNFPVDTFLKTIQSLN